MEYSVTLWQKQIHALKQERQNLQAGQTPNWSEVSYKEDITLNHFYTHLTVLLSTNFPLTLLISFSNHHYINIFTLKITRDTISEEMCSGKVTELLALA